MLSADEVASQIIHRAGPWIDSWKLQKLLYYVQAWHLAITNEPLYEDKVKAWKDGPVVPSVWHARKDRATRRAAAQHVDENALDENVSGLIDLVLASYGSMSGEELRALTHVEWPWREARGDLPPEAECREPIDQETMARYYRANRMLGGRTAADLAAAGVHLRSGLHNGPVDVNKILALLAEDLVEPEDDSPWGSTNLPSGFSGVSAATGQGA